MLIYDIIDSTQLEAIRIIDSNPAFCGGILAREMTAGVTTKKDIKWDSSVGNLYLTYVINNLDQKYNSSILFCVSLAILDFINNFANKLNIKLEPKIKWPNDIILNDKKISGCIATNYKDKIIIGIGMNLICHPHKTYNIPATDLLFEIKKYNIITENPNIKDTADEIISLLNKNIAIFQNFGFNYIKERWLKNCYHLNRNVKISQYEKEKLTFIDINEVGAAICIKENGEKIIISSGEIL
jgi:BirA family biotin operon repressor/biotin-[acetyl-CoA-carboxylase] ligase